MADENTGLIPSPPKDGEKTGKIFTAKTFSRDHTRFAAMLPGYLGAYIGPGRALAPAVIEAVMVTMNSYNTCPYCTGLHGQLARMAGADEIDETSHHVIYATKFAQEAGRGEEVQTAFSVLEEKIGSAKAASVKYLCWALLWGKTTGNSINNARSKVLGCKLTSISPLDLLLLVWYGPLFLVIGVLNLILAKAPPVAGLVSTILGAILWLPQAIFISPLGIICILLNCGVV